MNRAAIQLPYLTKPVFLSPCNGCGLCCSVELCDVATSVFGKETLTPCPALEYQDGRTFCGLMQNPDKYLVNMPNDSGITFPEVATLIKLLLGAGKGCGMEDGEY